MTTMLENFIRSLPDDTISALPFSERVRLLRELIEIDRESGIEPPSQGGLLHDIESLPAEMQIAAVLARAVEKYRIARRAA